MLKKFRVLSLVMMLSASAPLFAQRGGRGTPALPPQSRVPEGRFPGFPPNAGVGQPPNPGQPPTVPEPHEQTNPSDGFQPDTQSATATDLISRTPRLADRLAGMLGVEKLTTEPDGFRNLGLFVAAVEVSNHVEGATFEGLKIRLLGDETTDPMSLGEAIQNETSLNETEASAAAEQANAEAEEIIEETS